MFVQFHFTGTIKFDMARHSPEEIYLLPNFILLLPNLEFICVDCVNASAGTWPFYWPIKPT